jgi:superfamily II DNA or RNA helicase
MSRSDKRPLKIVRHNSLLLLDWLPPVLHRTLVFKWRRLDPTKPGRGKNVIVTVPLYEVRSTGAAIVHAGVLEEVLATCSRNGIPVEVADRRLPVPRIDSGLLDAVSWREGQREMVESILASGGNGIIRAPTAFGKSFIIRTLCALWGRVKVMVVTTTTPVMDNFLSELRKAFPGEVIAQGAGKDMHLGGKVRPGRILVAMAQSLQCVPSDWPDVILCDEVHAYGPGEKAERISQFYKQPRFGFSASPDKRGDGGSRLVSAIFGPTIFTRTYQQAQAAGMLPPVTVWVYRVDGCSEVRPRVRFGEDAQFARHNVWANPYRNALAANVVRHLAAVGDSAVLVLVGVTEHALRLKALLPEALCVYGDIDAEKALRFDKLGLSDADTPLKVDAEEVRQKVNAGWRGVVIATQKWSEGVDMPDLKYVVRASAQASAIKSDQEPGRAVRPKQLAVIVDFDDVFSDRLHDRYLARLKEYEGKGWNIVNVE